jgi:hypothetical protein
MATQSLEKKEKVVFKDVGVTYLDDSAKPQIHLPKGMDEDTAIHWLQKVRDEKNRTFVFSHRFKGWFPFDAMWAVYRALCETYGFAHVADFKTMFGPQPPTSVTIEIGYGQKQQIPWGPIQVSGISGAVMPAIEFDQGLPALRISAEIKNYDRPKLDQLVAKTEEILKTSSIYRGKAVEVDFTIFTPRDINFDVERAPKFMDTVIQEDELILPQMVQDLMDTSLWTPIRSTQECRDQKIPLRRGVLLAGKYGVGKTLAARVTAMLCEKHAWTYLYLRNLEQLPQALRFAKMYEPCVVFAEDINRVTSGDRDTHMDNIFNIIDGVDRKNDEVMIVFTTNDLDEIHAGMLRPGRIDTVVPVTPPDAAAATRLVRHYGRGLVEDAADLSEVGELLAGQIPAIIREAVERSKLAAIRDKKPNEKLVVRSQHLKIAAHQMLEHAKLLEEPPQAKPDITLFGEAVGAVIAHGIQGAMQDYSLTDRDGNVAKGEGLDISGKPVGNMVRKLPEIVLDRAGRPDDNT